MAKNVWGDPLIALATAPELVKHGRQRFRRFMARAAFDFDSPPVLPPSRWCPARVRLDPTVEAGAGMFDLTRRPWFNEILDSIVDAEVRTVALPGSTQLGKTLLLICWLMWLAENSPAPAMVVFPTKDAAIEFRDRLYSAAQVSHKHEAFRKIRVPKAWKWNSRYIDLGSMRIYLAWGGSRQRLRGRACKYVFLSEIDVYQGSKQSGNPLTAAHQRTKAFFRYFIFHESSPVEPPSPITDLEAGASARYRWYSQCPCCGRHQETRFFVNAFGDHRDCGGVVGFKNAQGDYVSAERARRDAKYRCLYGCEIPPELQFVFATRGRWVPWGCKVDADGRLVGEVPTSRRKLGYHLWSIHTDVRTFGDIAEAHVEAKAGGTLPEFFGNWLGLSYTAKTKIPTWRQLGQRMAWSHRRGTVPSGCWFLTAGVDVQSDKVVWSVRGWGPGCTSWLIDWGEYYREEGDETAAVKSDLAQIQAGLLEKSWSVVDGEGRPAKSPLGKSELGVRLLNCDSNHRTMDVHEWMRALPRVYTVGDDARVRAVRGDSKVDPAVRYRLHVIDQNTRTGETYEGGLRQWGIFVYHFYTDLAERLAGEPHKPGAWYVTRDAVELGEGYLKEVTNFHAIVDVAQKTGKKKRIWKPINEKIENDWWDTEIYAMVAAHMVVGNLGWTEAAWRVTPTTSASEPQQQSTARRGALNQSGGQDAGSSRRRINFRR